jgi:hypothetical protein
MTMMDFITEYYNNHSIYIYTQNMPPIELYVFEQMIKNGVDHFCLRYRASHYDKENFSVYLTHLIFSPEYLDKDELFIDMRVYTKGECLDDRMSFSDYMERREGNIFDNHNWDMINKSEVRIKFLNNLPV